MKRKILVQIKEMTQEFDLKILDIEESKHYKVLLQRPDGSILKLPVPTSPGDHRSFKNLRSQLRKIAKGIPTI